MVILGSLYRFSRIVVPFSNTNGAGFVSFWVAISGMKDELHCPPASVSLSSTPSLSG